jgi:hypothetical protein
MTARYLSAAEYHALKSASQILLTRVGGPRLAAAEITRGAESRLSEAASPQVPDRFLAIDQVADIESHCGDPVITRQLAALHGYDLVPQKETKLSEDSMRLALKVTVEAGQLAQAVLEAIADGRVTPTELRDAMSRAQDVHAAVTQVIASLQGAGA